MAPTAAILLRDSTSSTGSVGAGKGDWRAHAKPEDFILESWSEGFMVGALIIMACITVANMRRGVLLHKLILAEQLLAMSHGTFCFMAFKGYGWYLSSTAALLYSSWIIHNIVAWMKIRPFFCDTHSMFNPKTGRWVRLVYLCTLACTVPPIILQIFDNFRFFNNINDFYTQVRPYEPLMRDPWWVFTCVTLFHVIRKCYGTGVLELIKRSPRFGILLCAILFSLSFTGLDIVASIKNFIGTTDGINPWWKLSLVMKCLTDTIMLDDFKTELKRLGMKRIQKEEKRRQSYSLVLDDKHDGKDHDELEFSDALNVTNPAALRRNRTGSLSPTSSNSPKGRSRQDLLSNGSIGGGRKVEPKTTVGRSGTKISQLPGLKSFHFESIKPGRKGKKEGGQAVDLEKQQQSEDDAESHEGHAESGDVAPRPRGYEPNDRLAAMRQSLGIIEYRPVT